MATLATFLRRFDTATTAAAPRVDPKREPYRLRVLPMEDVFFYSKTLDNSRVVHAADPVARARCWTVIGAGCVVAMLLIIAFAPATLAVLSGYQVEALNGEQQALQAEKLRLEVEEAQLSSVALLEDDAVVYGLGPAKPGQLIRLNPKVDGELALNLDAKTSAK